ncbi:MAG: hypothetical protein OXU67_05520 [Chloroflexota bacterium]|nr:hypothetical protein [Chloroflexota bacterium]
MASATVPQVDGRQDSTATWSAEKIVRLGRGIYERDLRAYLEPKELGRHIAINVLTGEYAPAWWSVLCDMDWTPCNCSHWVSPDVPTYGPPSRRCASSPSPPS